MSSIPVSVDSLVYKFFPNAHISLDTRVIGGFVSRLDRVEEVVVEYISSERRKIVRLSQLDRLKK